MGIPTMQLNVLKDSYKESGKPEYMAHADARLLQQDCMFRRYSGVQTWHEWSQSKLVADGKLTSACGHTRVFFGRRFGRDIKDTVKEFLAHEPQINTTWTTNLAVLNLWNDKDNRVGNYTGVGSADVLHRMSQTLDREALAYVVNRRDYGGLLIEPLHQVHDAMCVQWPQIIRPWARTKMKQYFNNPITIAGQTITIPFDGTYGPSWGDMPHKI